MKDITIKIEFENLSINDVAALLKKSDKLHAKKRIEIFSQSGSKIHAKTESELKHLPIIIKTIIEESMDVDGVRVWVKEGWI